MSCDSMETFNLMPPAYKRGLTFRADLKIFLVLLVSIAVLAFIARWVLSRDIEANRIKFADVTASRDYIQTQLAEMDALRVSKEKLESRYKLLNGLKGDVSVQDLFLVMDSALTEDIEFETFIFERAGEAVSQQEESAGDSYFIILPESGQEKNRYDAWRIKSNMTIRGRARTHSAMANFMTAIGEHEKIERVELLNSGSQPGQNDGSVHFEFIVVINNRIRQTS
ncbi:MAG: hypothetical protein KDJ38_00320 [Gammaproteobacteria bacterium]|nr:hypothetical protein [Gammaproteobacteria bacterium]